ncbi:MAG TPA: M17 family peptidase N-terminal domain-containing protein [Sandaracinaceae bacterium LLY-WYZ-13_1]|nr:M17 family peptidase N-terminal domain-containing protein [Sandaracinaceae bacterium LLY-WYZ-13_1]
MDVEFVTPDLRRLDELKREALALTFFEDQRPLRGALGLVDWRLCGQISRLLLRGHVTGALEDTVLVPTRPRLPFEKLFLFGAGRLAELDEPRFESVVERMLDTLDRARVRASVVALPGRSVDRFPADRAMEIFLRRAAAHPEQDSVTLIEVPDGQRAMTPVVERERRRERAEVG